MKRVFTSLLAMLLVFAVGAYADKYSIGDRIHGTSGVSDGTLIIFEAASSTANYGYYIKENAGGKYLWAQGFNDSCVWKAVSTGTADQYNFQNVATGHYMAGTREDPVTVATLAEAGKITIYGKNQPWDWQTYSDQTANPKGWDDTSIILRNVTTSNDWWLANDVGNRTTGAFPNNGGLHNWAWNAYTAVLPPPAPVVPDTLTEVSQISNSCVYTITAPRGALSVNAAGTANVSATNANASKEETATQWAILKGAASGDGYFLYNIAAQKFITSGNTLSADSPDPVTVQLANNPNGKYIFKITSGANTLNNNNQGAFKLDSWSTEDDGNRLIIVKAGDFDASSLSAILSAKAYSNVDINGVYYNLKVNVNGTNTATLSEGNKQSTLTDIVVPATVTYDGNTFDVIGCQGQTFRGNATIKTIKFESDSLDYSLGTQIFENMGALTSINLPPAFKGTKQGLADWAFAGCASLTEITFPEGFTRIDNATTYNNASLVSMTIPSTVTSIGYSCFGGSTFANANGSYRVYANALTPPTVDKGGAGFAGLKNAVVVVPNEEAKAAYEANEVWSQAKAIILAGEKTTSITWNVVDSVENVLATETLQNCTKDSTYTTSLASYPGVTLETPSVKATDEDQTITTTYTFDPSALPFKLSARTDKIQGWYKVTIRGNKVLSYNYQNNTISDGAAPAAVEAKNAFAFVGTPFGFNIYNYRAGLNAPFGPAQNTGVALTAGAPDAAAMFVFEHSTEAGFENYNLIRYANNSTGYLNDVNSVLSVWNSTNNRHDAGSNFAFEEINFVSLDDLNALIASSDSVSFGTNPGYYTEASATAYNTAIANAKTVYEFQADKLASAGADSVNVFAVSAAYKTLSTAKEALSTVPLTDGYYIVYNDNENIAKNNKAPKAMFFDASTKEVKWGAYDDNDAKFVLNVTSTDAEAGTYTIQSVASGLYGGNASAFCGTVPAVSKANSLRLKLYAGTGSYIITGSDGAWDYCPKGNAGGTTDGPNVVWAYNGDRTGSGNKPYAEWSWRFEPYTATAKLDTLLANSLAATINGADTVAAGEGPGTYSQEAATTYNTALAAARVASENGTVEEKAAALKAFIEAVSNAQPTEITEGYYFITSAGNGPGYSGGPYNYEDKNALYNDGGLLKWKAYSREDKTEVYKFTKNADGNWDVYSLADSTYINKGTSSYGCDVTTSATPTTSQKFTLMGNGNGKFAIYSVTYAYGLNSSHNGSSAAEGKVGVWGSTDEARRFGINQWFLRPISETEVNALFYVPDALDSLIASLSDAYNTLEGSNKVGDYKKANVDSFKVAYADAVAKDSVDTLSQDQRNAIVEALNAAYELAISDRNTHSDYFEVAQTPVAPEVGKTYVIKNTGNGAFLSTKGGTVKEVNTIDKSEIWTLALSGDSVDGAATYYLKSATKADTASYMQYVDYGSKTWDETTPYDGYDWYNYAGFNGEFGADTTAQAFTILPATAYATPDTRSTVGENKSDSGYVFTAAKQVMGKYYKLDIQNTDAALDPYNNQVAWLFFEATAIEDADSALQLAINKYSGKQMIGGTAPGYYTQSAVDAYNEIVSNAQSAQDSLSAAVKRFATLALLSTDTMTFDINPIAEGYYYIVSAGNGPGYSGGPYNNEEKFALYNSNGKLSFAAYDANDTKYVYQITGTGDTLMVKNIQDNSYIASYSGSYGCDVLTSDGAAVGQVFTWEKEGKFAVNAADKQYVWATAGNHNGTTEASGNISVWGTPAEAGNYGVNLWYLIPCSEDMIQKITGIDGVAQGGNGTSVEAGNGKVTVSSDKAQTIVVVSTSGAVVARQQVAAGETISFSLVPGIYIVNGTKVVIK